MQIITITITEHGVQFNYSDGVAPSQGAEACRAVEREFARLGIEAEVERRVQEALEEES